MSEDNPNPPSPEDTTEEAISPAPHAGSRSDPLLGTKIGSCTLKSVIGSGGMGTVYEAIQEKPRRRVALKMMKRGITSRTALRRFEFESQTLARLKHQGVAQIYEAGTHDDGSGGVPYFIMEYIPNKKSLTEYADDKKLGTSERLALFSMVCDAVQHGHLKGIVHRDLKPGNILVGSNGQPKIIDFGIARSTDSDMAVTTLQTDVGQLIGTLQYMSPEQCEADPSDIDTRSDVYSLGVILYELLTGKPPYDITQMAIHEAVRIVREEEPTKLSTVDRHLCGDIETIALKALEKDRERRYQSATAMREDVQHYLNDEPITARPPNAIDYLRRFAKKYRAAAVAIAAVVVVLVVAVVGISIFAIDAQMQRGVAEQAKIETEESNEQLKVSVEQATKARADAEIQRELAEKGETDALRQAYFGNIHAAGAALKNNDLGTVNRRLETAREVAESLSWDPLPFEWRYLAAAADDSVNIVGGSSSNWSLIVDQEQRAVAFNPSGTLLASAGTTQVTQILDSVTGEELFTFPNRMIVNSVDFSPDGTRLAVGGESIQIWDMQTRAIAHTLEGHEERINSVAFSPDGALLASASSDETIRIWDTETGTILQTLTGHEGEVNAVAFSPDGTLLASCAGDKTLKIWGTQNWEIVKTIYQSNKYTRSLAFSPDGTRIAGGDWGKVIKVWDTRSGELLTTMVGHEGYVESVTYSPDGTRLASSGWDKTIRIWDAKTGQELDKLIGHLDKIGSVTFSPDGIRLASSSDDGTLRTWEVENQGVLETVRVNDVVLENSRVVGFAISPDSRRIALSSFLGFIMLDLKSNEVLWVTKNMPTGAIEFSPDGQSLLTTDLFGGIVRLWDVQSGVRRMIFSWDGSANEPLHLSLAQMADVIDTQGLNDIHATFNPDGSQILLWGSNGVRFWDIESEKLTVITEVRQNLGIGFNPESDQLITSQANGVQAWDPRTGELLENYLPPFSGFKELVFSPNGRLLATTDYEQKIVLWDTETRKQLFWLLGHEGINAVSSIAFNADGSRLVSGGRDKTIRIWDTESGEELLVFFVEDDIRNVAFSPDNTRLFACGLIRKVHIWDTKSKGLVAYERRIARKLANTLTPLVESWIQKASGNNELLFEMLEREIPTRSNEEVIALRNLVTKTITRKNERVQRKTITRQTIEQIGDDPDVLHAFLTGLLTTITVERFGSIADDVLVAATRACELTYFQNPIALFNLSRVHFMMGDHTKAVERFEQIDVLQIDDAQVLNRIAWTTVDSEDMEFFNTVSGTVLLAAQRACTLSNHSNGAILDTLARVHFERGEVSEAIHWQTEAVKYATSNLHDEFSSTLAKYQAAGDSHEPENPATH